MFFIPVHYLAILAASVASMILGYLWYSPMLFAKPWMKLSKLDEKKLRAAKKDMPKTYGVSFLATLVTAYVLSLVLNLTLITTVGEGLTIGAVLWLGFVAPVMITGVLFQSVPWGLFLINSGYQLASILAMSAILSAWY